MSLLLATRLMFVLGVVNLLSLLAVLSTCRCVPMLGLYSWMSKWRSYPRFYRYHCYYWAVLIVSVVAHVAIGIGVIGIPF